MVTYIVKMVVYLLVLAKRFYLCYTVCRLGTFVEEWRNDKPWEFCCSCRELLESMQAGTLEPEVAFLNALLVWFLVFIILWLRFSCSLMLHLYTTKPDSRYIPSSSGCTQDPYSQVTRFIDNAHSSFWACLQLLRLQACNYFLLIKLLQLLICAIYH